VKIKKGVIIQGLHLLMRPVLKIAEEIWTTAGRKEGATITSALDGVHSAGSFHPFGLALDFRTHYFSEPQKDSVGVKLKARLPFYDVVIEKTHIHIEPGNRLLARYNLLPDGKL
jgi:hypothetical protein